MARRFSIRKRQGINIPRVVSKVAGTIIALYAGGFVVNAIGDVIINTSSPFYKGLKLIGWTISTTHNATFDSCGTTATLQAGEFTDVANCVTSVNGAGVLAVVGIIGVASIVLEFIEFRLG